MATRSVNLFPRIPVGMGLWLPMPQRYGDELAVGGATYKISVEVNYSAVESRVVVTRLALEGGVDGRGITGTTVRGARFGSVMSKALEGVSFSIWDGEDGEIQRAGAPISTLAAEAIRRDPDDMNVKLLWIGRAYRAAEVTGGKPNQTIQKLLEIGSRTASDWATRSQEWARTHGMDWDGSHTNELQVASMTIAEMNEFMERKKGFRNLGTSLDEGK